MANEHTEAVDTLLSMAGRADRLKASLHEVDGPSAIAFQTDRSRAIAELDDMAGQLRRVARFFGAAGA